MSESLLKATGLTKIFGAEHALRGIDLSIQPGETVAVMGPSGSGKSTLLHCLSGVLAPTDGEIVVDGVRLTELSDAHRSRLRLNHFGFVFQDGQLLPELPARENVALPLRLTGVAAGKALSRAEETLAQLGLEAQAHKLPGAMSGGQAQRVAVARAIVGRPKIVFADEPTGALDQSTGHEVMQLLTSMVRMHNMALVMVTHDVNVASWCNRLLEIRDGRIHADRPVGSTRGEAR
ncbi:ABC transporter ATP-binding protein [Corynebacterium sp. TAE3-ERU12]|uniref:ABC transporter ATP-binding protein n=1 Tax=Corynebacterium sp. TAE3-ERU12 TaxID=2849491 RepID=UPI001C491022|nr:ABC transporter ATP-binding protein [Corynebacterium sp. TAE3-ERU12]MBV7295910.1 ABC transporter ATP-binding protein [Corynebacterium sp. TAE3-ERU12]